VCGAPLFQRSDETPEIQARRYEVYEQDTLPMIDYYRQRGILMEINGEQDVESVTRDILAAIAARKAALIAFEPRVMAKRLQTAADQ
jgi:adenylate kinase